VLYHRILSVSVAKAAEAKMTNWKSPIHQKATENITSKQQKIVKWI
jgi:hypothetical protein